MPEDMGWYLQKGLSEWWSEESAYLIQRIERWAAFARGYNRLKSVRLSKARMTMQTDKLNDDYCWFNSPSNIYSLKRSRLPDETRRINCCGTFNYQSNGNFNSTCLETYRYDHSIYFKTIGDIKNSKKELGNDNDEIQCCHEIDNDYQQCQYCSCCSNQQVELNVRVNSALFKDTEGNDDTRTKVVTPNGDVRRDYLYNNGAKGSNDRDMERMFNNVWPIVDMSMLNEDALDHGKNLQLSDDNNGNGNDLVVVDDDDNNNNSCGNSNNNFQCQSRVSSTSCGDEGKMNDNKGVQGLTRLLNFRKSKKSSEVLMPPIIVLSNNNSTWPGVVINCGNNMDASALSVSYQHSLNAK